MSKARKPLLNDPEKYTPEPDLPPEEEEEDDEDEKVRKLRAEWEKQRSDEAEASFDPKPSPPKPSSPVIQRVIQTSTPKPVPTPEPAKEVQPMSETPNKTQAIRAAIAAGYDKPIEGCKWILDTYGIEVKPQGFATQKSNDKRKDTTTTQVHTPAPSASKPVGRPAGVTSPQLRSSTPRTTPPNSNPGSAVEMIKDVRALMSKYGAEEVREIIDALSE